MGKLRMSRTDASLSWFWLLPLIYPQPLMGVCGLGHWKLATFAQKCLETRAFLAAESTPDMLRKAKTPFWSFTETQVWKESSGNYADGIRMGRDREVSVSHKTSGPHQILYFLFSLHKVMTNAWMSLHQMLKHKCLVVEKLSTSTFSQIR